MAPLNVSKGWHLGQQSRLFPKNMTDTDTNLLDTPFETWAATMAVNVKSLFAIYKFGILHVLTVGSGSIINMALGEAGYINGQVISCHGGHRAHPRTSEVGDFMASLNE